MSNTPAFLVLYSFFCGCELESENKLASFLLWQNIIVHKIRSGKNCLGIVMEYDVSGFVQIVC